MEGYLPQSQGAGDLADAEAWVVNLARTKPKDHGLAEESWTLSALCLRRESVSIGTG
ncbi:MAG: hypothetical protein ACREU8_01460 [Gammaproteobacteria bacterium]